ncbi:uncharacterized protein [Sinocyclocheilus grahami]|uniref:uncharacterized protein n=1 Tax=Sinocyclocheilus grahami TaxID=75366 RepID=UPI0007AD4CEB|nr:PREDICTED: uncharacterized protein LOC107574966 [Sinocyclocheilus grahami]
MEFIKEESEDVKIEEGFKHEDTEEQTEMEFEESENIKIKDVFSMKQEDPETQTKMAFVKEESEDMKTEDLSTYEDGETQTFIREESEDTKNKKAFRVKHEDAETQTDCPLCERVYSRLSQHLRVTHRVMNLQERKLLLAISSGRVDVRKGTCPVPTCGKFTSRIDRHLIGHTELTAAARQETIQALKMRKILHDLSELRASNPAVPMASTLDQEDSHNHTLTLEEEERACDNPRCQNLRNEVADLNRQVDTLSQALRDMTRRYCLLRRRLRLTPSAQVNGRVLSLFYLLRRQRRRSKASPVLGLRGNRLARAPETSPLQRRHLSNKRSTPSSTMCRL